MMIAHRLALRSLAVAVVSCACVARAADAPDDAAALELADQAPAAAEAQPQAPWRAYAEGAVSRAWPRAGSSAVDAVRASLDVRYDGRLSPTLRAVLSNRLDVADAEGEAGTEEVNTLREAYLSWQARPDVIADAGRINLRQGIAWGYNPTDFFKEGSLRSIVSPDPAMLRENRLGTVAVQLQKVWGDASVAFALSPKLASEPSDSPFSLDLGSTNGRHRWLVAASRRFGDRFNPQLLLHGGQSTPTQLGANVSSLLNDSTVGFVEFSTGKGPTLVDEVLVLPNRERWQRRVAAGFTYTTAFNLSFTVEADYNSAAPDGSGWDALLAGAPVDALRVLAAAEERQELPFRRGAFLYATWRDAFVRRMDLSAFARFDLVTHSREHWAEVRYRWDRVDVALQWQLLSGSSDSVFGILPRRRVVEASVRAYF